MAQRKPYNPNTKYGRKKLREQAAQNYANMTSSEKADHNALGVVITLILIVFFGGCVYLTSGSDGLMKWLSR